MQISKARTLKPVGIEEYKAEFHGNRGNGRRTLRRGIPLAGKREWEAGVTQNDQDTGPGSGSTESWPLSGDWAGRRGGPEDLWGCLSPALHWDPIHGTNEGAHPCLQPSSEILLSLKQQREGQEGILRVKAWSWEVLALRAVPREAGV